MNVDSMSKIDNGLGRRGGTWDCTRGERRRRNTSRFTVH
jgi:hypothetical protein